MTIDEEEKSSVFEQAVILAFITLVVLFALGDLLGQIIQLLSKHL